jgi:hypothetical protein
MGVYNYLSGRRWTDVYHFILKKIEFINVINIIAERTRERHFFVMEY